MKKNLFIKNSIFLLIFSLFIFNVSANVNLVMSEQNPDPVMPGNYVILNVKLSNLANNQIENVKITFVENDNFKISADNSITREIGSLSVFSRTPTETNYVIEKFKLYVNDKTPLGDNKVKFMLEEGQTKYSYEFDVRVESENPYLEVTNLEVNTIEPGKSDILKIKVKNNNEFAFKQVSIQLDLSSVDSTVISMTKGSNQITIPLIEPNQEKEINFGITASPDASSKPYLLPIDITYLDTIGNSYSSSIMGTVKIYSKPLLAVNLNSQSEYKLGSSKITLAIANPGTSSIKGTQITILKSKDYEVLDSDYYYVGDLNPDDFQTIQSNVYIKSDSAKLKLKVSYLDSYNEKYDEIIEVPLKIYSSDLLKNISASSTNGNLLYYIIFGFVILGFIVYYIGKKFYCNRKGRINF